MILKKLLVFLFILLLIDGIIAKYGGRSFGRSFNRGHSHKTSNSGSSHGTSNVGSSARTSYGKTYSTSSSPTKSVSTNLLGQKSSGSSSPKRKSDSQPIGSTIPALQPKKDVNTQFLKTERDGVIYTDQKKHVPPPHSTNTPSAMPIPISKTQEKPRVVTESKQSMPTAGTLQNQSTGHSTIGQTYPPWSNPFLGTNRPSTSAPSRPPWNNPSSAFNQTTPPNQATSQWRIPHIENTKSSATYPQSAMPISYPTTTGFKPQVYPHSYPTSTGTQFSPTIGGHLPYPSHTLPSNNLWSTPPMAPPLHSVTSVPLSNPYTMHTSPGMHNIPSHPQHPIVLAQPAGQPIVPGQPIILAQGQPVSGQSTGQMIKEALIFSTINAAVNRMINPYSHTHYQETRSEITPTTSTHITYNNQYFNIPPGVNITTNTTSVPQGSGSYNNYQNGAFTPTGPQVGGSINNYPSAELNSNIDGSNSSPSMSGGPHTSNVLRATVPSTASIHNRIEISSNLVNSTNASTIQSDQTNSYNNPGVNTMSYIISEDELLKISEELFAHTPQDLLRHIKLNLQTRVMSSNVTDEAKEPLFLVNPDILEYPTIYVTRSLYDKYEHSFHKKLNRTMETRKQENLLIDTFLNTDVMEITMQWLASHGFIDPDDFERKDTLRRIWFTMFSGSSCGFERVFASENYDTALIGVQDWIYFENQESLKHIDYMGYVDKLDIGASASLLKLNFAFDGIVRPNATIFIGTRPELEMSLYTICFYARPNDICPVSLAGTKFYIYTHSFTYFGNEIIDFALPAF